MFAERGALKVFEGIHYSAENIKALLVERYMLDEVNNISLDGMN